DEVRKPGSAPGPWRVGPRVHAPFVRISLLTMSPILQNLVEMTGHRDHLRLELSVLSTLQDLPGTPDVRALELFKHQGVHYVRPRTWREEGKWRSVSVEAGWGPRSIPLSDLPELERRVAAREHRATATVDKARHRLW